MTRIKIIFTIALLVATVFSIQQKCDPSRTIVTNSKDRFQLLN
jgi:hypothetical protein